MEDIKEMSYQERCKVLNKNVVLVARHFQLSVAQGHCSNGPLGKTHYYAICVKFEIRVNLHIHSFIWIPNVLRLTKEGCTWMDIIRADIQMKNQNCETWLISIKFINILKHVRSIVMENADSILKSIL